MEDLIKYLNVQFAPFFLNGTSQTDSSLKMDSFINDIIDSYVESKLLDENYYDIQCIRKKKPKEFMVDCSISRTLNIDGLKNPIKKNIIWAMEYEWNPDGFKDYFSNDFEKIIHIISQYKLAIFVTYHSDYKDRMRFALNVLNCNDSINLNNFYIIEMRRTCTSKVFEKLDIYFWKYNQDKKNIENISIKNIF